MKYLFFLLLLTACAHAPLTPEQDAKLNHSFLCGRIVKQFGGEEFNRYYRQCNDDWVGFQVEMTSVSAKSNSLMACTLAQGNIDGVSKNIIRRKINCDSVFKQDQIREARASLKSMDNSSLCNIRVTGNGVPKEVLKDVKAELVDRDADCQLVMALDMQKRQIQMQQDAIDASAEQARQQQRANALRDLGNQLQQQEQQRQLQQQQMQNNMYQQQMLMNANRPTHTNCYRMGNNVSCNTY